MEISYYEVVEYSNVGFGALPLQFKDPEEAIDWVKRKQKSADDTGNPCEVTYDVVPVCEAIYSTG